jgi:hypothetical protein
MSRLFTRVLFLSAGLLLSSFILHGCATTRLDATPVVQSYPIASDQVSVPGDERDGSGS